MVKFLKNCFIFYKTVFVWLYMFYLLPVSWFFSSCRVSQVSNKLDTRSICSIVKEHSHVEQSSWYFFTSSRFNSVLSPSFCPCLIHCATPCSIPCLIPCSTPSSKLSKMAFFSRCSCICVAIAIDQRSSASWNFLYFSITFFTSLSSVFSIPQ